MKLFGTLFLLFCPVLLFAQTEICKTSINRAPVIRGLKLRMSEKEVSKIFKVDSLSLIPTSDFDATDDSKNIRFSPKFLNAQKKFDDVISLRTEFFKEKLFRIGIRYSKQTVEFDDTESFAKNLSEKFDLPFNMWQKLDDEKYSIKCKDFELTAYANNTLVLTDLTTINLKRKEFSP